MKRARTLSFLLLSAVAAVAACSQSKGDPCQVESDCSDGLLCCPGEAAARGVCIAADTCPDRVVDSGAPEADASEPSDGEDSGTP